MNASLNLLMIAVIVAVEFRPEDFLRNAQGVAYPRVHILIFCLPDKGLVETDPADPRLFGTCRLRQIGLNDDDFSIDYVFFRC